MRQNIQIKHPFKRKKELIADGWKLFESYRSRRFAGNGFIRLVCNSGGTIVLEKYRDGKWYERNYA